MTPTIIPELENLLPELTDQEYNGLLDSIRENGQEDPIKLGTVSGEDAPFIIDGHNRYHICTKLGIEPIYSSYPIGFDNLEEAKVWMLDRQLERRNLSPFQIGEIYLKKTAVLAEMAKKRMLSGVKVDPTQNSGEGYQKGETLKIIAKSAGISHDTLSRIAKIKEQCTPEIVASCRKGEITVNKAYTDQLKRENDERNAILKSNTPIPEPNGKYQTIVIDPPWPMEKITREVTPDQAGFEYPTMTEEELMEFPLQDWADDQCHLYLWTTQRFLPMALRLMEHWGFNYSFIMTWMKNGGFQPFGLPQYNTEFVLFGKKGALPFLETKNFFTGFKADRREHSRKPDEFYDVVKRVSPSPRIDIFSREKRGGFEQFGNEADKFLCE